MALQDQELIIMSFLIAAAMSTSVTNRRINGSSGATTPGSRYAIILVYNKTSTGSSRCGIGGPQDSKTSSNPAVLAGVVPADPAVAEPAGLRAAAVVRGLPVAVAAVAGDTNKNFKFAGA